jgi:hypothetical protein
MAYYLSGWYAIAGNLVFPCASSAIAVGEVCEFTVYYLCIVEVPMSDSRSRPLRCRHGFLLTGAGLFFMVCETFASHALLNLLHYPP